MTSAIEYAAAAEYDLRNDLDLLAELARDFARAGARKKARETNRRAFLAFLAARAEIVDPRPKDCPGCSA